MDCAPQGELSIHALGKVMPALNRISPLIALPLLLIPFAVQAGTMPSYNITVIGPAGSTATALNDAGQVATGARRQESTMPDRSSVRQISRQAITTTMRFFAQAAS
jgi:hypothetical protein